MTPASRAALVQELKRDEGLRRTVYDDGTGKPIEPGTHVFGHPTIGIGRALDVRGISDEESEYLLSHDMDDFELGLTQRYIWFNNLDEVRQRVLINMAFNMGLHGIAGFPAMLACIGSQDYAGAAAAMKESKWYTQVGDRAKRLVYAMSTGIAQ